MRWFRSNTRPQTTKNTTKQKSRLKLETLEDRFLPAVNLGGLALWSGIGPTQSYQPPQTSTPETPSATTDVQPTVEVFSGGRFEITGTDRADLKDHVEVSMSGNNVHIHSQVFDRFGNQVFNGLTIAPVHNVHWIRFYGKAGDDTFINNIAETREGVRAYGGEGKDILIGSEGPDSLFGGNGNDVIYGNGGGDYLWGEGHDDRIFGGAGKDYIVGDGNYGTPGRDALYGGSGDDEISGGGERDFINGGRGNDILDGGKGNDTMYGSYGNDFMEGWAGHDYMRGGYGNDTINGHHGNDWIYGDSGNDLLMGGSGRDYVHGGAHADLVFGGDGVDNIYGGSGNDTLSGGSVSLEWNTGRPLSYDVSDGDWDYMYGGSGRDTFIKSDRSFWYGYKDKIVDWSRTQDRAFYVGWWSAGVFIDMSVYGHHYTGRLRW